MLFPGPDMARRIMEERVKDSLRHAEQVRLIRAARPSRPGRLDRVRASIAGFLIAAGKRLQGQYAPAQTKKEMTNKLPVLGFVLILSALIGSG